MANKSKAFHLSKNTKVGGFGSMGVKKLDVEGGSIEEE
jgi:hypothetical protein